MKITNILKIDFDNNRIYGLDILRALAILFVLIGHSKSILPNKIARFEGYFILDGVSIFFVLSGFLIGTILIKLLEKEDATFKTLLNFWIKRWFRTLPLYLLILTLLLVLSFCFKTTFSVFGKKEYFVFLQNFNTPHPAFFTEAWSLSVEEWFYLIVPSIIFFIIGVFNFLPKKTIIITAVSIIIFSICFRYFRHLSIPINTANKWDLLLRKQVVTRLDSLMFGLIGAYVSCYYREHWFKYKTFFFAAGIIILITQHTLYSTSTLGFGLYTDVFFFTTNAIGTLFLLPYLSALKTGKGFIYTALTYISLISYSMYLLNFSVIEIWLLRDSHWINSTGTALVIIKFLLFWILTVVGSILLYKYFEKPFIGLRLQFKIKPYRKVELKPELV